MANTFAPFGLSQTGGAPGAAPNAEQAEYPILYSNSTKIFSGDPVAINSSGYIEQWNTVAVTDAASGVSQLWGVFVGCKYLSVSQSKVVWSAYWPGADAVSGSVYGYVVPCSPGTAPRFLVQVGTSYLTQTDVGRNYNVNVGTGSTVTGRSGAYLDTSTGGTDSWKPFRVLSLYNGVGNGSDATSAYNWVIVAANTASTTGI